MRGLPAFGSGSREARATTSTSSATNPSPLIPVFPWQEARVTTTPLPDAFRLTGGLDLCGLDMRIDRRRVDSLVTAARRLLGVEATTSERRVWRGLRPCSPDGLPLIGRARSLEDLIVCTGHAMLGLTLALVSNT